MFQNIIKILGGDPNKREIQSKSQVVEQINALEPAFEALSDEELLAKTDEFRARLAEGETLDDLLPEAFAAVREASKRTIGLRHFDVQMIGGMTLHEGKIAEMRTGEGKTLVATLALYLNGLTGQGAHLVTVNDYLARRDARWMAPIYHALGLTVGVLQMAARTENGRTAFLVNLEKESPHEDQHQLEGVSRKEAYQADITYGTNAEFGFDYLRDNLTNGLNERVQRGHAYAIIDEVDNILIDEARTPLIISGPASEETEWYVRSIQVVRQLNPEDYEVDEKNRVVSMTEIGEAHVEELLGMTLRDPERPEDITPEQARILGYLEQTLRAQFLYKKNKDYLVQNGKVVIVDEFTGRLMPGRRWSEGLHQAVEAKEGVKIEPENITYATITLQNYFRMYTKLAGMTGTADTEAYEFQSIYGLEVVVIPTHRPMVRKDEADVVFLKAKNKYDAIIDDIRDCYERGQPVLVGTTSIETSEYLSGLLRKAGVPHEVLNAKQHEREAIIVAQAGRPGSVTIATNMAGRGTDIVLGGNLEAELEILPKDSSESAREQVRTEWTTRHAKVMEAGGLRIIGTERHESRRIDNQLRGRSGRQGDPGSSRFYLSLEDNLLRIFMGEKVAGLMRMFGMKEDDAIQDRMVTKQIMNAQRKVEAQNFDYRKNVLEFDDVANDQRKVIYEQRNELLESEGVGETVASIREDVFAELVRRFVPPNSVDDQWNISGLEKELESEFGLKLDLRGWLSEQEEVGPDGLLACVEDAAARLFREKEALLGDETMRSLEKHVMLSVVDNCWKEHLTSMDYLRQGIYLRGYAQKQPKQEFKRESFLLFEQMLERIKHEVVQLLARVRIRSEEEVQAMEAQQRAQAEAQAKTMQFQHAEPPGFQGEAEGAAAAEPAVRVSTPVHRDAPKVGRNEPCPCGSGKKYKQCHGSLG